MYRCKASISTISLTLCWFPGFRSFNFLRQTVAILSNGFLITWISLTGTIAVFCSSCRSWSPLGLPRARAVPVPFLSPITCVKVNHVCKRCLQITKFHSGYVSFKFNEILKRTANLSREKVYRRKQWLRYTLVLEMFEHIVAVPCITITWNVWPTFACKERCWRQQCFRILVWNWLLASQIWPEQIPGPFGVTVLNSILKAKIWIQFLIAVVLGYVLLLFMLP